MKATVVESYQSEEIDGFEIRVYASPTTYQKRYEIYIDETFPAASADTRCELLAATLCEIRESENSAIQNSRIILILCREDIICHSTDGCDLLEGKDIAPMAMDVYETTWKTSAKLRLLERMVAEGAFTDVAPSVEIPDSVSKEEWEELGRKLESAGEFSLAKQYAQGQALICEIEKKLARVLATEAVMMESGFAVSCNPDDASQALKHLSMLEKITGEPFKLSERIKELASKIELCSEGA